jgi:hypothetical protein
MGAEEFPKAPVMHHKLTTLAITRYTAEQPRSEKPRDVKIIRLK